MLALKLGFSKTHAEQQFCTCNALVLVFLVIFFFNVTARLRREIA